jgi:hypothetical protein
LNSPAKPDVPLTPRQHVTRLLASLAMLGLSLYFILG